MSSLGSPSPFLFGGAAPSYDVDRSLRFNRGDTTQLTRTLGSTSNRRTFTYSFWIKRTVQDDEQNVIYNGQPSSTPYGEIRFEHQGSNIHELNFYSYDGSMQFQIRTNRAFRDPSAWYHIVCAADTTQGTESNRIKIYINGVQETDFKTATYPSQNTDTGYNISGNAHNIGALRGYSNPLNGYLAEINFIDGYQYDASYFGETNAATGQWIPKKYTGSYGTNGFYLNFSDNSGTTATTLGKDSSGNGNNFTPSNFSVSAGKDDDSSFDSPTNNFPTLSPFDKSSGPTVDNGNLRWYYNYKPASKTVRATMALPSTGKIYMEWENEQNSGQAGRMSWGLVRYESQGQTYDYQAYNHVDYINISFGGSIWNGTTHISASWPSFSFYTGERAALAIDCSNGKWWVGKVASNGSTTWYANDGGTDGDPAGGTNESATLPNFTTATEWMPFVGWHDGGAASSTTYYANINFGNHSFLGTAPTGFTGLSSDVLATPTIKLPNKHFDTLLWSGNATTSDRSITGLDFQPDWAWTKTRNHAYHHALFDSVRGAANRLNSDQNYSENFTNGGYLASFDDGAITWDYGTGNEWWNESGKNYVAWNWNAGDTDSKTYTVTVVNDGGNKYRLDGFGTSAVTLSLAKGGTYTFNYPSAHPLRFSTTSDGTHGGGSEYTSGVSTYGSSITITVAANAPTLYYYCSQHSGMGGQVNPTTTLGSSNFDGTLQATVKANTTAGFSIVAYTGNGTSGATVGHDLGVAPSFIITKQRSTAGHHWRTYHAEIGATKSLYLDLTNAESGSDAGFMNNTEPTSTVFSLGDDTNLNENGQAHIAYLFSEVAGYSKFGSYTGNGSSNGTFVFTGFRPAWVMIKNTSGTGLWIIADATINSSNVVSTYLQAQGDNAEYTGYSWIDLLSNGFKARNTGSSFNTNGSTMIYLAFAEAPFKYANAR